MRYPNANPAWSRPLKEKLDERWSDESTPFFQFMFEKKNYEHVKMSFQFLSFQSEILCHENL